MFVVDIGGYVVVGRAGVVVVVSAGRATNTFNQLQH